VTSRTDRSRSGRGCGRAGESEGDGGNGWSYKEEGRLHQVLPAFAQHPKGRGGRLGAQCELACAKGMLK